MSLGEQVLLVRIHRLRTHGKRENMRSRDAEDCCPFGLVCACTWVCSCACVPKRLVRLAFVMTSRLVSLVVYTPRFSNGTYLCAIASQAQKAYASDVPAQVYKSWCICACLCMRGFAWVAQVGFLVFFLFEHSKEPRACYVCAFSCKCSRSPMISCIEL